MLNLTNFSSTKIIDASSFVLSIDDDIYVRS
jgi:hypothetical protein